MPSDDPYPLLSKIDSPDDLRRLPPTSSRRSRPSCASTRPGREPDGRHFAAGLGTVELTVALHYVYDTPHDRLVWDVGHQAYPHKVLTGRRNRLQTSS